jgi:hypothetical protein
VFCTLACVMPCREPGFETRYAMLDDEAFFIKVRVRVGRCPFNGMRTDECDARASRACGCCCIIHHDLTGPPPLCQAGVLRPGSSRLAIASPPSRVPARRCGVAVLVPCASLINTNSL